MRSKQREPRVTFEAVRYWNICAHDPTPQPGYPEGTSRFVGTIEWMNGRYTVCEGDGVKELEDFRSLAAAKAYAMERFLPALTSTVRTSEELMTA